MKNLRRILNSNGVALITVVMIFLVLVILLGAVMFASVGNQRNTLVTNKHTAAFYAAESAISLPISQVEKAFRDAQTGNWSLQRLKDEIAVIVAGVNAESSRVDFDDNRGDIVFSELSIQEIIKPEYAGYVFYRITSTGHVGSVSRVLYTDFGFNYEMTPGSFQTFAGAVVAKEGISVNNESATIDGKIASNLEGSSVIKLMESKNKEDSCSMITKINVLPGMESKITGCSIGEFPPIDVLEQQITFSDIVMPNRAAYTGIAIDKELTSINNIAKGHLDLTGSNRPYGQKIFKVADFTPASTLQINLNGTDEHEVIVVLVENNYLIPSTINVYGMGRIVFMMDMYQSWQLNTSVNYYKNSELTKDPSKVSFVLYKVNSTSTISQSPNTNFLASILTDVDTSIILKGNYGGFLISNATDFDVQTPNSQSGTVDETIWMYTPNADFSFKANSILYGSVMTKSMTLNNPKDSLIYKDISAIYPFKPWTPLPYTIDQDGATAELKKLFLPIKEE